LRSLPEEEKGDGNGRQNEGAYDGPKDDPNFRFLLHDCDDSVCEIQMSNGMVDDKCSKTVAIVVVAILSRP
jgi:hypothetical protein